MAFATFYSVHVNITMHTYSKVISIQLAALPFTIWFDCIQIHLQTFLALVLLSLPSISHPSSHTPKNHFTKILCSLHILDLLKSIYIYFSFLLLTTSFHYTIDLFCFFVIQPINVAIFSKSFNSLSFIDCYTISNFEVMVLLTSKTQPSFYIYKILI